MARVQADPEPLAAAGGVEQRRQLLERAPERAAGAGRVLEVQRAALGLRQRLRDHLAGALDRLADVALLGRARVQDHAASRRSPSPTRSDWVSEASDLSRISRSSEAQLSRYTAWISTASIALVGDRLAERGEVVVAVGGRAATCAATG